MDKLGNIFVRNISSHETQIIACTFVPNHENNVFRAGNIRGNI